MGSLVEHARHKLAMSGEERDLTARLLATRGAFEAGKPGWDEA